MPIMGTSCVTILRLRFGMNTNFPWLPTSAASAAFSAFPAPVGALWPATRLIDIQLAAVELYHSVRRSPCPHLPRRPSPRTQTRAVGQNTVGHDTYAIDRTISCEQLTQFVFTGLIVKVPNEDVLHVDALS